MPLYSFVVELGGHSRDDIRWTYLPDHAQAHRHARLLIQTLKDRPQYSGPGLTMIVKDADGAVIHIIPF